jgi:hypothetical protein
MDCSDVPHASSISDHASYISGPAKKRRTALDEEFDDWKDTIGEEHHNDTKDEITSYIELTLSDEQTNSFCVTIDGDKTFDIAKFWYSDHIRALFPLLSRVAVGVLSIPSSSASSERVFSTTGRIIEKRRTQLSQHSVDALVFLHSKYHAEQVE